MKINHFFLFLLVIVVSILLAYPVGVTYVKLFNIVSIGFSSFIVSRFWSDFFDGVIPSYIFVLPLIFVSIGGEKKYWWIGILLIPAALFELYFDAGYIYFPIALGLLGWVLGLGVRKLILKKP